MTFSLLCHRCMSLLFLKKCHLRVCCSRLPQLLIHATVFPHFEHLSSTVFSKRMDGFLISFLVKTSIKQVRCCLHSDESNKVRLLPDLLLHCGVSTLSDLMYSAEAHVILSQDVQIRKDVPLHQQLVGTMAMAIGVKQKILGLSKEIPHLFSGFTVWVLIPCLSEECTMHHHLNMCNHHFV